MKKWFVLIMGIVLVLVLSFFFIRLTGHLNYTSLDTCQDSDIGYNYEVKGVIKGTTHSYFSSSPKEFIKGDFCENQKILVEYSCQVKEGINSNEASKKYECLGGCKGGVCLKGEVKECSFFCSLKNKLFPNS